MADITRYRIRCNQPDFTETEALLFIEMVAIQKGGRWADASGQTQGEGLTAHYLNFHRICFPEDEQHRWLILGMTAICENKVTCLLGCANAGKTYLMALHALITFWCFPETSFSLFSSTQIESLKSRAWGRGIVFLFNRAKQRFPWLPGYVLESRLAILTSEVADDGQLGRNTSCGIRCVPCTSGGKFIGMSRFQGIKPPNSPGKNDGKLTVYGDEVALMENSYLDAFTNWMANSNFKGVLAANPTDIGDPICIASEPVGGWDCFVDAEKTQTWNSKWYNACVVAYDGRDTPNNDPETKDKYPFLASSGYVAELEQTHGADSWEVWQQGIGKPSRGMVSNRVITMGLCERHKAFDGVVWVGGRLTHIYHVDPAYGGGDRCIGMESVFGQDQDGNQIFSSGTPDVIPIKLNSSLEPEEQIAEWMFNKSQANNIPPENMFYDSFGRGTLGSALAKLFGSNCPVPVDSGARPTARPVRFDLYVKEKDGTKRLKRCDEHYSKFVTEMWFSVREVIESGQMRNLQKSVAEEGQSRLYVIVMGNKVEVESKDDMKKRIRKSPDLFDCLAIGCEGARRLGFQIKRIGSNVIPRMGDNDKWLREMAQKRDKMQRKKALTYA